MPRYTTRNHAKRRRWAKRAIVCSAILPLFLSPLNALRIPSVAGPSQPLSSTTRRYAVQVEEELSVVQAEQETTSEQLHTEFHHYAFQPVASVKIIGVDNLHHDSTQQMNGHSNGFPMHAVRMDGLPTPKSNKTKGRTVNGVQLPPYTTALNGKAFPDVNGVTVSNGSRQPATVNGVSQPVNGRSVSKLKGNDNAALDDGENDGSDTEEVVELSSELENDDEEEKSQPTVRKLWKRRHARSIEEGVRCEKTMEKTTQLSRILSRAPIGPPKRAFFARTITGLINALAEEADGLEVKVDAQEDTPLWRKKVNTISINFSRLGFKPLRMGGLDEAIRSLEVEIPESRVDQLAKDLELAAVSSADEAFDRIDEDNSGALDQDEIAKALNLATSSDSDKQLLDELASQLVELYDFNGDGVVDREEYQNLVADMATLRRAEKLRLEQEEQGEQFSGIKGFFGRVSRWIRPVKPTEGDQVEVEFVEIDTDNDFDAVVEDKFVDISDQGTQSPSPALDALKEEKYDSSEEMVNISEDAAVSSISNRGGSIVLEDLKLDLRQLVFGMLPGVKRITPGGPLILEPFTATMAGSFTPEDIKASMLLDMGLRRLVARALRRRVRSFRDLMDGAVFYGRRWNIASKSAPLVEVPELTSVEFDDENRMIITGRAQVRASPDAPFIENAFKVRTKGIGTSKNGQCIRLVEPELAFVLECPKSLEKAIRLTIGSTGLPIPPRPKPLYSFFPIYSPFQVADDDGFDMGEDNRIKSIEIRDGALQFELSAVLRPGRFLGNHYLAFTLPMRTFIITMARVREGIRTARRNKRAAEAKAKLLKDSERKDKARSYLDVVAQSLSSQELVEDRETFRFSDTRHDKKVVVVPSQPPAQGNKSFFSRFVDGYLGARQEASDQQQQRHQRLTSAISDWFGRQSAKNETSIDATNEVPERRRQEV